LEISLEERETVKIQDRDLFSNILMIAIQLYVLKILNNELIILINHLKSGS